MTHRFSFGPGADLLRHIPGMEDEDDEDAAVLDAADPEQLAGEILSAFIANARKGGPR